MIYWDEEFCQQLVDHGYYVVRFDNRDIGLSQKFESLGMSLLKALFQGNSCPKTWKKGVR